MEAVLKLFADLSANWQEYLGAATACAAGLLAVALIIPGDQPDKALQGIVDFLKKFSKK